MGAYTFIISYLDENPEGEYETALAINIKGSSKQAGAALDVFPRKPDCTDSQLWESVQSTIPTSGGGWWYFLKSKSNSLVITAKGDSLEMSKQKSTGNDDQLWEFSLQTTDGLGYRWYLIQNKQNDNAISVKGSSKKAGTPLELDSPAGNPNQLWMQQSP